MSEFRSNNNASRFFQPWNRVVLYSKSLIANNPRVKNAAVSETELCTDEAKMRNHSKTQRSDADTDIPNSFQRTNVVHYLRAMEKGQYHPPNSAKALKDALVKRLHRLRLHPFHMSLSQEVSTFTWHPTFPNVLLAGSDDGEIAIHRNGRNGHVVNSHLQTGKAHITTFKFHPERPSKAYLVYRNGIELLDFHEERIMPVVNFRSCLSLTSFDAYPNQNIFVCGDSKGDLHFRDENGKEIYNSKHVHQNKITHIEFSRKDTNIYSTASCDHTVKIWDVRMMPNGHTVKPLSTLVHETGVNSACFSPTDFSSLLTTDYCGNLNIYSTGPWDLKLTIAHHYRHQRLMSTKASWHPLCDIIVVSHSCKILKAYSIEFYDADTGNILRRIEQSQEYYPSLCSLNSQGDILAANFGHKITFYEEFNDADAKINHLTLKTGEGR